MIVSIRHLTRLGIRLTTGKMIYFFFNVDSSAELTFWTNTEGGKIELTSDELKQMHDQVKSYHTVNEAARSS